MSLDIRPAAPDDAAALAAMMDAFNVEDGRPPGLHTPDAVYDEVLGPDRSLEALIAWDGAAAVGYVLFLEHYDTSEGGRAIYMHDLWVRPERRSQGIGRRMMTALARVAVVRRRTLVWWGVDRPDVRAHAFYRGIGAADLDGWVMELHGPALGRLGAGRQG